ncbi:formylglycine-generating enzyme family protein [Baaleninema simplex]|uniref:formylglycine-generating enzyme family protein n=1 Tax=Baaleninema simplex TaxID=2862350 RepID=UPI000347F077|nr:formylglycine-generating enzyme family protein [Baaleninema simplex]
MQASDTSPKSRVIVGYRFSEVQCFAEPLGNGVSLEMTLIPAGEFLMGSPENELERRDREGPQHPVRVPQFFLGTYPVTQAQWRAVTAFPKVEIDLESYPSRFKGDNRPVEQVSWLHAVEFCRRLSRHTGRDYRLPSEAEWEYACRAGTQTPFHFGETLTTALANYNGKYTYGEGVEGKYRKETTEVGSFPANGFGLYDMHGNVWEWCEDDWHENYNEAPRDGSAWVEKDNRTETRKVLRGGSWFNLPRYCRSAYRDGGAPGDVGSLIGFRVACGVARTL